jgi:hypothetical protein
MCGIMKVKAPFLIETRERDWRTFGWVLDAGYVVSGLVALPVDGKLKTCWVWAQGFHPMLVTRLKGRA